MTDTGNGRPPFGAVLCDVDNVIRSFDSGRLEALERVAGIAEGTTKKVAFALDAYLPLLLGEITSQEWAEAIAADLADLVPEPHTAFDLARALLESPFHADDEVVGLLRRARVRVPLVLVSNAALELESDLDSMGLSDLADHVVNSARVGLAKPDPRIYRLAADLAGVGPDRCLFVDDGEENVTAAAALGMHTVHFREPADLERALEPLFR
ncbi:HAD family hydrolase [Streptomyces pseudovenezuelae]|uniref:Hydrolase of the HAD superfamily n=1 Tax=Streptomyces pseudovenezuelae TaxID=67350 RepID=A0ABT6LWE1_9ACTN|nr:HAD family phosphatase [Streptomyces pseudovenezuelae]MDH6220637.1 putative hydrolase of the HAD superfamily [Streptomyces pseudovenezuelae]